METNLESKQHILDIDRVRADFPILRREVRPGIPLTYLDSTATSQKPQVVIEAMNTFYRQTNANIHRGIHTLAEEATAEYEAAREKVAKFINAGEAKEIIFTRNTRLAPGIHPRYRERAARYGELPALVGIRAEICGCHPYV